MTVSEINEAIANLSEEERNQISDGVNTFGELYSFFEGFVDRLHKFLC